MNQAKVQYPSYLKRAFEPYKDSRLANWEAEGFRGAQPSARASVGLYYSLYIKVKGLEKD